MRGELMENDFLEKAGNTWMERKGSIKPNPGKCWVARGCWLLFFGKLGMKG